MKLSVAIIVVYSKEVANAAVNSITEIGMMMNSSANMCWSNGNRDDSSLGQEKTKGDGQCSSLVSLVGSLRHYNYLCKSVTCGQQIYDVSLSIRRSSDDDTKVSSFEICSGKYNIK